MTESPIELLIIDDDQGDIDLALELLQDSKYLLNINVLYDGEQAVRYLQHLHPYEDKKPPDIILLDLNLPKKHGLEVLSVIKQDEKLKLIPVIILTTSNTHKDILNSYALGANCYVTKPLGLDEFINVIKSLDDFWFSIVKLPQRSRE